MLNGLIWAAPLLIQNRQRGPKLKQSLTGRSLTIYGINRGALWEVTDRLYQEGNLRQVRVSIRLKLLQTSLTLSGLPWLKFAAK